MTQRLFEIEREVPTPKPAPKPSEAIEARCLELAVPVDECENCHMVVQEAAEWWSAEMQDDTTANLLLDLVNEIRSAGHPECLWLFDISYYERAPDPPQCRIGRPPEIPNGYLPDDFNEDECDTCGYWWMLARHWLNADVPTVAVRLCGNVRFNLRIDHAQCWFGDEDDGEIEAEREQEEERPEAVQQSMF